MRPPDRRHLTRTATPSLTADHRPIMQTNQRTIIRRLLSPEVVKAPRAVVRLLGTQLARAKHAARAGRSPMVALERAVNGELDTAVESFRDISGTRFFVGAGESRRVADLLAEVVPGWRERTLADADRICARDLRLLGADSCDLAGFAEGAGLPRSAVPWHHDVINDYEWNPRTFYKQVPVPYDRADMKVPWELSRSQHLTTVAMAHAASGDPRYAREVVSQIEDWIASNPVGYGINWVSSMDAGIRVANWLWAYRLIDGAPEASAEFTASLLASLLAHGRHIESNISIYEDGITTNHTVADYASLLYLGLMLPELDSADRWVARGLAGLTDCMRVHVHADGVDYENSIAYHRLVTEMYLSSLVLAERNGRSFPDAYRASLERMLEFVMSYSRPDGLAPLVGDSDDGRWHLLSDYSAWEPLDHRYLLAVGSAVFGRDDFAAAADGAPGAVEEVAWLLGAEAAEPLTARARAPIALPSRAFRPGGRFVMRHGKHHALISCDEVGTRGYGNHKHNDILSFELMVAGSPLVVDPGTYAYLSDRSAREAFRATRAHNTLVIDGTEQNDMPDTFRTRLDARVDVHTWRSDPEWDVLDASHSGYERLEDPVRHRRTICFRKAPFGWLVLDVLEGDAPHAVDSFVHLAPGGAVSTQALETPDRAAITEATKQMAGELGLDRDPVALPDAAVSCETRSGAVSIIPIGWPAIAVEDGWVAPRFGQRERAPVLRMSGTVEPGTQVGYLILEARPVEPSR
jgi:hypothetical protein